MKKNLTKLKGMKKKFSKFKELKKIAAICMLATVLTNNFQINALAESENKVSVYVTISDKDGNIAVAQEKIDVTDIDNDGVLTINDALYLAHEAKYDGGAKSGYNSSNTEFGISLNKLWGNANGGSYGYYVNNISAMSLKDSVNNGDYIHAYSFTDLTNWSDTYSYFNVNTAEVEDGKDINLKLLRAAFDEAFNPVTLPVEGAVITLNGEKTEYKTDKDGNVKISIEKEGVYVISAISDNFTIVAPVCIASVKRSEEDAAVDKVTANNETTSKTDSGVSSPQTGDYNLSIIVTVFILFALSGLVASGCKVFKHSR